ncbi:MAG: FHA domain-containing protein [Eubacterium sp.]|nr:FHA domain-containing protein [Eubacterium sp.]
MDIIISLMRYISPVAAIIILFTCVISLFRNRPRVHTLARLVNQITGETIDIDHWETSIGRSKSNDIVLRNTGISRFHAVIAKKRRDWIVKNTTIYEPSLLNYLPASVINFVKAKASPAVPVFVNGKEIDSRTVIENGDIIKIGEVPLRFECDEALSLQSIQQMRTAYNTTNVAYGVLVDIKTKRPIYLKKQDVLIGRGNDCDIQIMSETVSSNHARIHRTSRGWAVSDLDSHNGTKLNGRYITQPQLIFDEDMLTFGDKVFIFYEK